MDILLLFGPQVILILTTLAFSWHLMKVREDHHSSEFRRHH